MASRKLGTTGVVLVLFLAAALPAAAQSFMVQCPDHTITHPNASNSEPAYVGPTYAGLAGYGTAPANINGAIKCQQISGGDGFATMGDGTQTYLFAFGPLSGLAYISNGLPGTAFPSEFNTFPPNPLVAGDPATTNLVTANSWPSWSPNGPLLQTGLFGWNGAVGLAADLDCLAEPACATKISANGIDGHVDPRPIMDVGVLNGNMPAPLMALDEDDEFFLTLSNVGQVMRPDLFEQHTVHWHGYPNASAFYDGVPDASVAINIGGSFTYYYLAADAGTYFWHCHITPPEHLQMGMVGQLYVRPRQNRVAANSSLYLGLQTQQLDLRTRCDNHDILCSNPLPFGGSGGNPATHLSGAKYAY